MSFKALIMFASIYYTATVHAVNCRSSLTESQVQLEIIIEKARGYYQLVDALEGNPQDVQALNMFVEFFDSHSGLAALQLPRAIKRPEYLDFLERILKTEMSHLKEQMNDGDRQTLLSRQRAIVSAIISADTDYAFDILMRALDSNNPFVAEPVAFSLDSVGRSDLRARALVKAASSPIAAIRRGAAVSIRNLVAPQSEEIENIWQDLAKDNDETVRMQTAFTRGRD